MLQLQHDAFQKSLNDSIQPDLPVCTTRRSLLCRICSPGEEDSSAVPAVTSGVNHQRAPSPSIPPRPGGAPRGPSRAGLGESWPRGEGPAKLKQAPGRGRIPAVCGGGWAQLRAAGQSEPPPRAQSCPRPGPDKESAYVSPPLGPQPPPPGRAPVLYFVLLPKRVHNKSFGFFLCSRPTRFAPRGPPRRGGRPGGWGKRQGLGYPERRLGPPSFFRLLFI